MRLKRVDCDKEMGRRKWDWSVVGRRVKLGLGWGKIGTRQDTYREWDLEQLQQGARGGNEAETQC